MPENANIFWAESYRPVVDRLKPEIENDGHTIIYQPKSFNEALDTIDSLTTGSVNIAIVDENLSPYDSHGADGREIAYFLKFKDPGIFVIGYSSRQDGIEQTDLNLLKDPWNPRPLLDAIKKAKYPHLRSKK